MSRGLTFDDRTLLAAAAGVSLVLIGLTAALGPAAISSDVPTTYSAGSIGAKASYMLLEASRYSVGRWERPLRDLPDGTNTTLILAEPAEYPTPEDRTALAQFIEQGGRVIVTGYSGGLFLPEHRGIVDPIAGLTWKRVSSRLPSLPTRAAPEITLAPGAFWDSDSSALTLYGDDKARVVKYTRGHGEAIWWASATPLTNAGVREPGNLEFFLACVGEVPRVILWDEYVHGYRQAAPTSLAASQFQWAGYQVALLVTAVLVTYSRRSGPIVAEAVENRLSPLEFVRTLGALYRRAGAASVVVDIAYQRFRYRLTQRVGTTSSAPADELQRAVRDRWRLNDPAFGDLLRKCDSARHDPDLRVGAALALTQALWEYSRTLDLGRISGNKNA